MYPRLIFFSIDENGRSLKLGDTMILLYRTIREWYDRYRVGDAKLKIHNVFSIVNYSWFKQLRHYGEETDTFLKFKKLCLHDEMYNKLTSVLINKTV